MAWTSVGFDGTITEIQWAGLSSLLGNGYVAAGNGDCLVTAVGGARQVSVAAGSLYGDGVLSTNSGAETVALTTPTNGQWYVVALRRTWATNTAALVAIAGATTTTTTPTAPPTSFPTLNTNVGVLTDQPIAWAWCNSANTTVVVYDIRLKAVKSLPPVVATSAERDAKFMSPTQGLQVWRDDLGAVETYYGLYNSSTNPGGRDTAGWYTTNRTGSLIPLMPSSVTAVTGSATVNSLGVVSFSGVTSLQLAGVFSSLYQNYKVKINLKTTVDTDHRIKWTYGATAYSTGYYGASTESSFSVTSVQAVQRYNNAGYGFIGYYGSNANHVNLEMTPSNTNSVYVLSSFGSNIAGSWHGGYQVSTGTYPDGFLIYPATGTTTGTIEVFGYND